MNFRHFHARNKYNYHPRKNQGKGGSEWVLKRRKLLSRREILEKKVDSDDAQITETK